PAIPPGTLVAKPPLDWGIAPLLVAVELTDDAIVVARMVCDVDEDCSALAVVCAADTAPAADAAGKSRKSSPVIGSLYLARRKCCSTSRSMLGGYVPGPDRRWYWPIARTYCWPRKTSSASFSRRFICFHTGMAAVIMMAM